VTTYIDDKGRRVAVGISADYASLPRFVAMSVNVKGQRRVVPGLEWRDWFSDAQTDLDALAEERGWEEVEWFINGLR
jgi:hypothetical protein